MVVDRSQESARPSEDGFRGLVVTDKAPIPDQSNYKPTEPSFRRLFESAPDALVLADAQGRIILVNAQTEHLFGYGREERLSLS